ncbi:DUF4959 domain-containing protein [Prolixibacteraceae bacterium JC049]|nr:DUF4959 domain-containing protein [Prolixibacteraceae bacterium JC049]
MKRIFKYIPIAALLFAFGCEEEGRVDFIDKSGDAPAQIENVVITPVAGGGVVGYSIPKDENFAYVKAVYEAPAGVRREAKSSKYANQLILEGFGDTLVHNISFYSVGKNTKESKPLNIDFKPLKAPIFNAYDSLKVNAIFGGVELKYKNPTQSNLIIELYVDSLESGNWEFVERYYTKQNEGRLVARGLQSKEMNFGVLIKDPFGNKTETLSKALKPLFEIEIPKTKFKDLKLPNDSPWLRSKNPITHLWDNKSDDKNNFWASDQGKTEFPKWISIDFGDKYILSRMKQWMRKGYEYNSWFPVQWEVYGSNDPNPDGSWDSWTFIHEFGAPEKPSGLPMFQKTAGDEEFARKGLDYEFENIQSEGYRYYRIRWNESNNSSNMVLIAEMTFFGQYAE